MPHWNSATTEKTVCTVCGAQQIRKVVKYDTTAPREHRPQTIRKANRTYEIIYEGYIPKELLGVINQDHELELNKKYDNHCISCETGFNGPTNDICPTCRNTPFDADIWNYEEHATSHAGLIEVWQQGQPEEVADSRIDYSRRIPISRARYNSISAQMMTTTDKTEKQKLLKQCISINKYNDKIHAAELTKAQNAKKARAEMLSFDISRYNRYCKGQQDNTTTTTEEGKQLKLFECPISKVKDLPQGAEIINVTRTAKSILSPSWNVLNQYKKDKDQIKYIGAFMKEMTTPKAKSAMMEIIEKAKDHPVYLSCFEVSGFCHRFLLVDWIKRLATV